MFEVRPTDFDKTLRLAIVAVLGLSLAALGVTIWVMIDFLDEQRIVEELIRELPTHAREKAETLEGELKWQFRLSTLVVLNLIVTGFAVALLSRAYRSSQASLRDVKALAADVLGSMDLGILTTDREGLITTINRRGGEMLGVTDSCIGSPLSELDGWIPLESFRQNSIEQGTPMTRDFVSQENQSFQTLRALCQPLKSYRGEEIGNILQLLDVTERVLIDIRLRRMERYMGLGSLTVGLHHEIKNPLAALSLHVQLLEEQVSQKEAESEEQQLLQVIRAEVDRVGDVLESFRDFASIDELHIDWLDLRELIARQSELLQPRADRQNVQFRVDLPAEGTLKIRADRIRLEQVLLNLAVNALDAMPDGGTLALSAEAVSETDNVRIEVTDSGNGISDDLCDKVFDPYFTTKSDGTGLGLALCDKIVRQHHGSLDFHTSDRGTTFCLTLPIDEPSV